jgi:protoheme IX farnesyltransferase
MLAPAPRTAEARTGAAVVPVRPATAPRPAVGLRARLGGFVALTKPRIIELLLVTTLPTMFVAARGVPSVTLMVATLVGGTLAAGGANAINMVVDRDIDAVMKRTSGRPLVTGVVTPRAALVFAVALEAVAFGELWAAVNPLSAVLAVSATLFYVFVYTLWLKRSSSQNIVIGGAAGAVPVLVGWAAVTGRLGLAPLLLFALIFVWTPPHFWALAIKYREDYASVDVPMMPVVRSIERTSRQIIAYTVLVVAVSLAFGWAAHMGPLYWVAAAGTGAAFLAFALRLHRERTVRRAMALFGWSITYITLLFAAMAVDVLVR